MRISHFLALSSIVMSGLLACRPVQHSNFGVEGWQGRRMTGETVQFQSLGGPGLVLNVYRPSCGPCNEELPALNQLYVEARQRGIPMYLVVTAFPNDHGLELAENTGPEQRFQAIRDRLAQDQQKYSIAPPLVIMEDTFRVAPANGLITGTPETLFFRREPLVLEYNFIGAISHRQTPEELAGDSRYLFAVNVLDRMRSVSSGFRPPESSTGYGDSDRSRDG